MSFIASIRSRFLIALLAIITISACSDTEGSTRRVAFTCPPGMALAAKQGVCVHGTCGNGILDTDETCDDGNVIAGDGCSPDCRSTESCGNGKVDHAVGEVCDDGNTAPDDRCCSDCRSCPELAVPPVYQLETPAEMHIAAKPEPCPPAPPTPEAAQADAVQEASGAAPIGSTPAGARAVLHPARFAAPATSTMGRLGAQSHTGMGEELALARSTIFELEQSNAELRRSLEDALRELTEAQRRHLRGVALQ